MPQELIQIYIELLTTINNAIVPLVAFLCLLILTTVITKFYLIVDKAYINNQIKEEEIKLLKEKYRNENKH